MANRRRMFMPPGGKHFPELAEIVKVKKICRLSHRGEWKSVRISNDCF